MLISPDEINKSLSNKGWKYADKKISNSSPEEVTGLITGALKTA